MKKIIPILIAAVLIAVIVAVTLGVKLWDKFSYSEEYRDLTSYYEMEAANEAALIMNQEVLDVKGRMAGGYCYLSLAAVHDLFNDRFYADYNEGLLLYSLPDQTVTVVMGEQGSDGYIPAFLQDGVAYVALDYVRKYTNFAFELFMNPNRAVITTAWDSQQKADIKKDTAVRYQGGVKSDILRDLEQGESIVLLETLENWSRVATGDGLIGYVENKRLENIRTENQTPVTDYAEPEYTTLRRDYRINLGWHQVVSQAANSTLDSALSGVTGMNVISPTWFFLSDNEGGFVSIGDTAYVEKAHGKGLEVWALLDNFTYDVDTKAILSYTGKRAKLVNGLIAEAKALGIDGINVDLEQVPESAGQDYIQFIRELSIQCRANGLVLSVDNYVPKHYNAHYYWEEQGVVADYVIIMGYDEHYAGSQEAGSVASIGYVEEGISTMAGLVPAEKIINAVPFYTRVWETKGGSVSSQAVGMTTAEQFLASRGITAVWDEETCQNYAEFNEGDSFYQVWLEDAKSLETKMNIMKKYGIGGVASWKLGYESGHPEIWSVLYGFVFE